MKLKTYFPIEETFDCNIFYDCILSSEKPIISSKPYSSLIEDERLTLTCQADEATKKIRWTKDYDFGIARANISQNGNNNSTLVIEKVLTSDSGNYSCEAIHEAGSAWTSVYISVTGNKKKSVIECFHVTSRAATLVFLNKGTAAMLVFPTNPRRIKLLCKYFITLGNKENISLLSHGRAA